MFDELRAVEPRCVWLRNLGFRVHEDKDLSTDVFEGLSQEPECASHFLEARYDGMRCFVQPSLSFQFTIR
ncbi:hypothetical protein DRO21_05225 [archaeon]|nr:MAG: hypothetical protein DRO21_05225 [archaeon]